MRLIGKILSTLIIVAVLSTTCCTTTQVDLPPAPLADPLVSVAVQRWEGIFLRASGTGVIIHSSIGRGTYVLTNAHVLGVEVDLDGDGDFDGMVIPRSSVIVTSSGRRLEAYTVHAKLEHDPYVDIAILHIPYTGTVYNHVEGISKDGIDEYELVYAVTFMPEFRAVIKDGVGEKSDDREPTSFSIPIRKGNSGSGVFEKSTGLLAGLIWGVRGEDDGSGGYSRVLVVESPAIIKEIKEAGLDFLLTD